MCIVYRILRAILHALFRVQVRVGRRVLFMAKQAKRLGLVPQYHFLSDLSAVLLPVSGGDITSTSYLPDAKIVYGMLYNQVSTMAALMNLFKDGSKMGKPVSNIGIRGYVILCRLTPNWNMGFRPEGTVGVGQAGVQGLQNATVALKYAYVPILITGQAEVLTKGDSRAFMQARALEAKFDAEDITSHLNVIAAGAERGGQLAQVLSTSGPGALVTSTAGLLPGSLYLRVNMPIDTAPVGGGALTSSGIISAINYATNAVTYGSAQQPNVGDAIYLTGEAPPTTGAFPYTMEGLRSLIDDTIAIQGLDPTVQAQAAWKSFVKDVGAVQISPALLQEQRQFTFNRGGKQPNMYLVPSAQINQYVAIATTTLRFDVTWPNSSIGKKALDLGFLTYNFGGLPMIEDKDLRPDRVFSGDGDAIRKFEAVPLSMAEDGASEWTRVSGANGIADAVQGLMRWYIQLGIMQRSAWSRYQNFTVPTSFQNQPPTL
jgi:hypothetical protein